jgi:hypothetical protein
MPTPGKGPVDLPIVDSTGSRYSLVVEYRGQLAVARHPTLSRPGGEEKP